MNLIYQVVGLTKQSFLQKLRRKGNAQEEKGQLLYMVSQIRKDHPRMSAREIYYKLKPPALGRDKFEQLCFGNGFRVATRKNYRKTTDSSGVIRFPNLVKDTTASNINQVFVSDITYFEINGAFYYITLIMDLFNREVVGYWASESLRTGQTTLPALQRLIQERGKINLPGAIIHSDGGGQYYSKEFRALTNELKMRNSMTEESLYENTHAERLNGIIKNNYLYPYNPTDLKSLRNNLQKAVRMYNQKKSHRALKNMTPEGYKKMHTVGNENNEKRYSPFPTENHKNVTWKSENLMANSVNVF